MSSISVEIKDCVREATQHAVACFRPSVDQSNEHLSLRCSFVCKGRQVQHICITTRLDTLNLTLKDSLNLPNNSLADLRADESWDVSFRENPSNSQLALGVTSATSLAREGAPWARAFSGWSANPAMPRDGGDLGGA